MPSNARRRRSQQLGFGRRRNLRAMSQTGEYEPSPRGWVRDQVEAYERSGGAEANTLRDTGLPIVVMTVKGHRTGKIRKIPLMRIEHDGDYALVGSVGGAPKHPEWVHILRADPDVVLLQDGPEPFEVAGAGDRWRRAGDVVGAGRCRLSALRVLPGADRTPHPGLRGRPRHFAPDDPAGAVEDHVGRELGIVGWCSTTRR